MKPDLIERLWASDAASALTNEAARALEDSKKHQLSEAVIDRISSEIAYVIMRNINGSPWADMYPEARKSLEDYQEDIRQDIASGLRRLNDDNKPQRQDSGGNEGEPISTEPGDYNG